MDKYIWILCIVLIIFIFYIKFNFLQNNRNNDILRVNTSYETPYNNQSNTLTSYETPYNNQSNTLTSSNIRKFDESNIIKENIEERNDSYITNENAPYNINTQDLFITNANSSYRMNILDSFITNASAPYNVDTQDSDITNANAPYNMDTQDSDITNASAPYNMNTQDSVISNVQYNNTNTQNSVIKNVRYNTNTERTYDYNKKGILAKIIPEPIPENNQKKVIKKDYNPRIESFAPIDQLLVESPLIESNYINQLDFSENTSGELPIFTAETVSQMYDVDNITSLYNTINADIYKGYKTIQFI
jgi:hypothetical protein